MTDRLAGRTCFLTAAGAGIGRASAIAFAGEGATVIATDIDRAARSNGRPPTATPTGAAGPVRDTTMSGDTNTLEALSEEYRASIPTDLRTARPFQWYLDELRAEPAIARNAHQRVIP